MGITYEQASKYLIASEIEGSKMYCEFQVPQTQEIIASNVSIKRSNNVKSQVERVMKRTATNQLRRTTSRILRQTLGRNMLGRTLTTAFNTATRTNNLGGLGYSNDEKQAAIVEAFKKVADYFPMETRTTNRTNRKISINKKQRNTSRERPVREKTTPKRRERQSSGSPFEQQWRKYPVKNGFDQEIMARMLVELANSDRNISEEERTFLASFISPEIGSISQLLAMDPLSPIECEEVSPKVKKTIYMLAWTISLIDYDLNQTEKRILMEYADMFELGETEAEEAVFWAKSYALEQGLTATMNRAELYDLAAGLELSEEAALRIQIQWKKRS